MEALLNFSLVIVVALKRGAGSLALGRARREKAARSNAEDTPARKSTGLGDMREMKANGSSDCQLVYC